MTAGNYTNAEATYHGSDLPAIVIDFLGTYWVQFIAFASLLALAVILVLLNKSGLMHWFGRK